MEGVAMSWLRLLTLLVSLTTLGLQTNAAIQYPEDAAIGSLEFLISVYHVDNQTFPEEWNDFTSDSRYSEMFQDLVNEYLGDDIAKYYSFAPANLRVSKADLRIEGGKILIIGNGPLKKPATRDPGRYVIWLRNERAHASWLPETKIKTIYERAQIPYNGENLNQARKMYVPNPSMPSEKQELGDTSIPSIESYASSSSKSKSQDKAEEIIEDKLTQPATSFPWLLAIAGLILLAVIAVIGFKVLNKSS
ncbi:MAG: hypothetical protein AAFY98_09415 [Verrucomicrobiota bacterium]